MTTLVQVVYPGTPSFSGTAQLNEGPFFIPSVNTLIRCEARGRLNFQGVTYGSTSVQYNALLWSVQWVPHGSPAQDCITTADGPNWLIRERTGDDDSDLFWGTASSTADVLRSLAMHGDWAGQLAINASIDVYMSLRSPEGASVDNFNLYATLRFWWA